MATKRPPQNLRRAEKVAKRDGGWFCHYCGISLNRFTYTLDHKKPRAQGGRDAIHNRVLACQPCNSEKGDQPYAVYKGIWAVRLEGRS